MTESPGNDEFQLQKTLYQSRNPTRRWLHTSRRDRVLRAITQVSPHPGSRALEVGPGGGPYLPFLCQQFDRVTAIDSNPAFIGALQMLAVEHSNLTLRQADLLTELWPSPHDLVLCSEVLEHVPDPDRFIGGLARATANDGILVLTTPQPWSTMELTCHIGLSPLLIGLMRRIYGEPVLPTGHISLCSRRRVLGLLAAHHFEVLHSETFGLYLPLLAEFGGSAAVPIAEAGERLLQRIGLTGPLWTQLHVARKIGDYCSGPTHCPCPQA